MKIGSLCTGYGGLDLAVEAFTGATVAWTSDIDHGACSLIEQLYPDVSNIGDVKTVDWMAVEPVDVMTAGYPCQPFSSAGKRKGEDDPRHIFPYIAEGIRALRPRVLVLENVRNHLRLGFGTVLGTLADLGYDVRWGCLRASDAGAPHRRERVFILASDTQGVGHERRGPPRHRRAGPADSGDDLPDSKGHGRDEGRSEPAGILGRPDAAVRSSSVAPDADGAGSQGAGSTEPPGRSIAAVGAVTDACGHRHGGAQDGRSVGCVDGAHESGAPHRQRSWQQPEHRSAASLADPDGRGLTEQPELDRRTNEGEPEQPLRGDALRRVRWGRYTAAVLRWERILGRAAPEPTRPDGRNDAHRLNPVFVEWMLGLDEGRVTGRSLSRNQELKLLGNGVVPQQAYLALELLTA